MVWLLAILALTGWSVALVLYDRINSHVCPVTPPTKAVLVNASGLPESVRHLRGKAPESYARGVKGSPSILYKPAGIAVLYQAER